MYEVNAIRITVTFISLFHIYDTNINVLKSSLVYDSKIEVKITFAFLFAFISWHLDQHMLYNLHN